MRSLRRGLLQWTLGALAFGSIVLVLVAYVFVLDEMNEVLDDNLREVASAVGRYHAEGQSFPTISQATQPRARAPDQSDLITRVWRRDGQPVTVPDSAFAFPFPTAAGARRTTLDGVEWRTCTVIEGDFVVLAAQRTAARQEMAVEAASKLLFPLLLLALMIAGLLVLALRRGLSPLHEATTQIAQRNALTLEPIDGAEMPRELQPLVGAFNGLMDRLAAAFAVQQQFVADAAHELRSPVTALRLQIGLLEHTHDAPARAAAFHDAREGIDRLQRMVEQLLALSRAEPGSDDNSLQPVDLDQLVRDTVSAHAAAASRRQIDLGAAAASKASVLADPHELQVLLNNLVRNALHYSPAGSKVDVATALVDGAPVLRVTDNGPGIPQAERARAFDRFFRGEGPHVREGDPAGSGLGLAIVKSIAERHGATVSLHEGPDRRGLEVRVQFAAAARASGH
ncbi:HAMP domain-containing sensor histidine kinase [Variovorax sp. EL159]|uniref:sensor histidine kinase n=1 Tax=Variovorax sp. EL159 TaxID=1566270 RepID=UPI0008849940|nr:ATP-binding protein [Variovorax sp. EL159]SCX69030.1 two-component system, OmpR family, sensor kinase [Variovorax sp. EL159]